MLLKFLYSKQKLKKSDLHRILYEFEESLNKWAESYFTDIEVNFQDFKTLSKIQKHFPDNLAIYFAKISYPPNSFSNESLFEFVSKHKRIALRAGFAGNEWPDTEIDLNIWNPHFMSFNYYHPLFVEEISSLKITPSGFSSSRGSSQELLKYLYAKLGDHFQLPSFEDCIAIGSASLPEAGVSVNMYTMGGMQFSIPAQQNEILLKLLREYLELMKQPLNVSISLIDNYRNIIELINNESEIGTVELKECGIDTVATGELGAIKQFNLQKTLEILKEIPKSSDVKVKLSHIKWRGLENIDTVSTIGFNTERRGLYYWIELYLYGIKRDSKSFKQFTNKMKLLTDLPFDKGRLWKVHGYEGSRYSEEITRIKRFYIEAYYLAQSIIRDYKERLDLKKFKTCGYYDAKPGIFIKTNHNIPFKNTLMQFVSKKMPEYKYDSQSSRAQSGQVSFVRTGKYDLLNYIVFQRDPKWGSKIFRIEFYISKQSKSNFSPGEGYSWYYEKSSEDFLNGKPWWLYDSETDLIDALENASIFVNEAGEIFFNRLGDLMREHLKASIEKNDTRHN